jgi:hypothetical protein
MTALYPLCNVCIEVLLHRRPNFFYASVLIFFHNVLQCEDELPDVPTPRCAADRPSVKGCKFVWRAAPRLGNCKRMR